MHFKASTYDKHKRRNSGQLRIEEETRKAFANDSHNLVSTYLLWYTEFFFTKALFYSKSRGAFFGVSQSGTVAELYTGPKGTEYYSKFVTT
jgi:hypothetical protein